MGRFKVINESPITGSDDDYLDLSQYLKNHPAIVMGNKTYKKPQIVKSPNGKHIFEIYDEIENPKNKIYSLLQVINNKLDLLLN
jgi:hypothetical protein